MVPNSTTTILRTSPLFIRSTILSPSSFKPLISSTPFQLTLLKPSPPPFLTSPRYSISTQHPTFHRNSTTFLGFSGFRFKAMDAKGYSRIPAVSDDGSGGGIGGSGAAGGLGGGGGGSEGNEGGSNSNWSPLSWYLELLAKFPVMTKAVTSALLSLVGDLICQLAIDKVSSLDYKRTFMFTFMGLVLVGPSLHFWYLYLSKVVTLPGASGAIVRLLLDQFLFAPVFIGICLSTLVTLEGRPSQIVPKLQQEWLSSVIANWQLWIPFQFLNFRFVPQQFQVLASNFVALIWNAILSFKAHKEVVPK